MNAKSYSTFSVFFFLSSVKVSISQPSTVGCSLDFQFSSPSNSSCGGGDWGGFLNKKCCGAAFDGYLYALGLRANQTGLIYLNSTEQMSCLASIKVFEEDVFGCGIEKLTSGAGGCSDYTLADVTHKKGYQLRSLSENCKFFSNEEFDQSCGYCVRSWAELGRTHAEVTNAEKVTTDICRFSVLVSLISSRVEDKQYIGKVYKCLGEHSVYPENYTEPDGKSRIKPWTGTWALVGSLLGIAIILFIAIWILSKRCHKSKSPANKYAFKDVLLKQTACPRFRIKEVYSATNNLNESNVIGEGTAGKVYRGILPNNQHVAVKHIINEGNAETFVREVTSVSHVRHPNLVTLLGYCLKQDECFLIYELCPNGNLSEWLFGKDKLLSWIQRLEIAIGSAEGLWFLHTYSEGCIVHRDVKPTNILLGPNFEAKLSDFGLSKVIDLGETYVSSEVRGTFGYVDPEYHSNRQVNSSGDVYSFGIVLLQILSGKKALNFNLKRPMPLNKMAREFSRGGSITDLADPKMEGNFSAEAFDITFQLAVSCTSVSRQQRPSMGQVVSELEKALAISTREKASSPEPTRDQPS